MLSWNKSGKQKLGVIAFKLNKNACKNTTMITNPNQIKISSLSVYDDLIHKHGFKLLFFLHCIGFRGNELGISDNREKCRVKI